MFEEKCFSTGVIKRDVSSIDAHIEIANLTREPVQVCVFAFDWDTNPPIAIPVIPGSPIVIRPNNNQAFDVSLTGVQDHYEIRISLPDCYENFENVIANVFALDINGNVITGNTVLFKDLVLISECSPCDDC